MYMHVLLGSIYGYPALTVGRENLDSHKSSAPNPASVLLFSTIILPSFHPSGGSCAFQVGTICVSRSLIEASFVFGRLTKRREKKREKEIGVQEQGR